RSSDLEMFRPGIPDHARGPAVTAPDRKAVPVAGDELTLGVDDLHPVALVDVDAVAVLHGDGDPEVRREVLAVGGQPAVVLVPPHEPGPVVVAGKATAEVGDLALPDLVTGRVETDHVHG